MNFLDPEERDYLLDEAVVTGNVANVQEMIAAGANIDQDTATGDVTLLDVAVDKC